MPTIPRGEGARGRRRAGLFWIEEGDGPLWAAAAIVVTVIGLYAVAAILNGA